MIKFKRVLFIMFCIIFLTGCNKSKTENKESSKTDTIPVVSEIPQAIPNTNEDIKMANPDLTYEEEIKEYFIGEWVNAPDYWSSGTSVMDIDKDLNINLSFENDTWKESKREYSGKIRFDREYDSEDEAPDLIYIELTDSEYVDSEYFFLHRTIYDEKNVMSLFFADNGASVFELLTTEENHYTPPEVMFEKTTGVKSNLLPIKEDEFYAAYWGIGIDKKSIWLDDVIWTPQEEDDLAPIYTSRMNMYENYVEESILYDILPDQISEILGDDLMYGEVYYVQTDSDGNITNFINADLKAWIEESYITPEIREEVISLVENIDQAKEYINLGMTIEFDGSTIMLDGDEYYIVILGTQHEDYFVSEINYAVNTFTEQVYLYDYFNDMWERLEN